jgi:SNF2 family DNA or RNA helicase
VDILYPFQTTGVGWLMRNRRAYLADDMGLGKTVQVVVAATRLGIKRLRVICPAVAVPVWHEHFLEWGPGIDKIGGWQVISYDMYIRQNDRLAPVEMTILDEAQYCKETTSKRAKAALTAANRSQWAWLLSGTPMPNHPGEMYAPLRAVWPDLLREVGIQNEADYREMFCVMRRTRYGMKCLPVARNPGVLRGFLERIMLRRRIDEVGLQLPPIRWHRVPLDIDPFVTQLAIAQRLDPEEMHRLRQEVTMDVLPKGIHVSKARRVLGKLKAEPAARIIAGELQDNAYKKIVVLAYHHDVLDVLQAKLTPFGCVRLDGKTPPAKRREHVKIFQQDRGPRVFLGQLEAAGVALTLTAAHEVAQVEQLWSPAKNEQAVKRVHRIGQKDNVRVRVFVAPESVDDVVGRTLVRKASTIRQLMPGGN